ncbi:hypothetical protein N5D48_24330 [Pseudomonas sp. GD03858]|uniref:hypothetical protein n=1 Tax=unclassified Pseudomonas TaxID=196821 RepID=UPI002448DB83|nr:MULTISPECIES: hypothetical protein [unclassified Pseudomonas]MDH0647686.1 hypothetical protein [Pseudomonas sp. GD03867]MDH0665539.1 hypothetical protein [Pseudomonas sp. GD03858]
MHENHEIRRVPRSICHPDDCIGMPRFIVIPAGIAFYHVVERATGRTRGFRQRHADACALARAFER